MKFFNAVVLIAVVAVAVFALPFTTAQAVGKATTRVTAVAAYTKDGKTGTTFMLMTDKGDTITLFAPTRPFEDGKNTPVVGEAIGFSDQLCVAGLCGGAATFTQKSGKATIKIVAFRV